MTRGRTAALSVIAACLLVAPGAAQRSAAPQTLAGRIDAILARPEFKHATFGIEFLSLDTNTPIYTLNADKLFVPGSTTKLVTMGSAMQILGADYRFHTRVYRAGDVDAQGTLHGDLVLVASGDTNLSGRIRPGDTLAFENVDHSYGGPDSRGLEGDPLRVIRELAASVAKQGVKRVDGSVIVDASLFPEGERDGGTGFVISPMVVNDNAIDILVTPGKDGDAAVFQIAPVTSYARVVNRATTGKAGSAYSIHVESDVARPDGTRTVTIGGTIPADVKSAMYAYRVPQPSRFAEIVFAEALHERGIVAAARPVERPDDVPDVARLSKAYTPDHVVAEHVSPPFSEEAKITLKVSQNLHASATPFLLGTTLHGASGATHEDGAAGAGFVRIRKFLESTGADVSGASQSDGAGAAAHFTPDFMVHYLAFMAKQPTASIFHDALPILGKDGTLWNIQVKSAAAGHVYAKTGTYASGDLLHEGAIVDGKGLAGYMTTADGRHLVVAIYANNVPLANGGLVTPVVGDALGEIAAAAYDAPRVR
jgi:D-alanyl-D-alanine carboxypeptidase/D-alanyl-D-alanine-endopeptidase (penicillin-binding protein 4)